MARHPADLLSLAFGFLFASLGLLLLTGGIDTLSFEWVGPLAAIILGALLIVAARSIRTVPSELPPED